MPILSTCGHPRCETLTIGPLCLEHDVRRRRVFARGRPYVREVQETLAAAAAPRSGLVSLGRP